MQQISSSSIFRPFSFQIFQVLTLFFVVLVVYIHNLSPAVTSGDSGDFLLAVVSRSPAHPPGYPLYLLLGTLFYYLPLSATAAWKIGLFSAVTGALTVSVFFLLIKSLTKSSVIALISATTLGFTYSFWLYTEVAEVFSLHHFFVILLFSTAFLFSNSPRVKYLYIFSFLLGLSFTHQQFLVLIVPSLAVLIFSGVRKVLLSPMSLLYCFVLFILGLMPYLSLFAASAHDQTLVWGKIDSISSLVSYISRQDYGWIPNTYVPWSERSLALWSYILYWSRFMSLAVFVMSLMGVIYLWNKNRTLLVSLMLGFVISGPFFLLYASAPILNAFSLGVLERFYTTSFLFFIMLFPFGVMLTATVLMQVFKKLTPRLAKNQAIRMLLVIPFAIIPLQLFVTNLPRTDLSHVSIGSNYAQDLLISALPNSILFTNDDTASLNVAYMQYEFSLRPDVTHATTQRIALFIDSTPLYAQKKEEIFRKNPRLSQSDIRWLTLVSLENVRPVFSASRAIVNDLTKEQIDWVPYGLLLRARNISDPSLTKEKFVEIQESLLRSYHISEVMRMKDAENLTLALAQIPEEYSMAHVRIAEYLLKHYKDADTSKMYYEKALVIDPENEPAIAALHQYFPKKESSERNVAP